MIIVYTLALILEILALFDLEKETKKINQINNYRAL
jgi:cbb3-type cytochrome oxidase cytochrome c subunit